MLPAAEQSTDSEASVVWGAALVGLDGGVTQFAHARSEEEARDLIARVLASSRPARLCWGVARVEFVTHTPPLMPPGPGSSTPVPRPTEFLPNPFSESVRTLSADHRWASSAAELEAIFDAQAERELPMGSDHAAFGEGPGVWGYIHLNSARQLQEFVAKPSEIQARDFALSLPGLARGRDSDRYPSIGVARIEFVTLVPPVGAYKPMKNPFTELLRTQSVRPIAPDLLPRVHELESIFDTNEEARRAASGLSEP
jgi:hypothetical protein